MKTIVTLRNDDGSYDKVGMNNRLVHGPLRGTDMLRHLAFSVAEKRKRTGVYIEFFSGSRKALRGTPCMVEEWTLHMGAWSRKSRLARV